MTISVLFTRNTAVCPVPAHRDALRHGIIVKGVPSHNRQPPLKKVIIWRFSTVIWLWKVEFYDAL